MNSYIGIRDRDYQSRRRSWSRSRSKGQISRGSKGGGDARSRISKRRRSTSRDNSKLRERSPPRGGNDWKEGGRRSRSRDNTWTAGMEQPSFDAYGYTSGQTMAEAAVAYERQGYWRSSDVAGVEDVPARFSPTSEVVPEMEKSELWPNTSSPQMPAASNFAQGRGSTLISEFDPDISETTSTAFVRRIDEVGMEKRWSSEEKKFHFSGKLLGAAKEWFLAGNKILESWAVLKKQFVKAFPSDMDFYKLLTVMIHRVKKPEEDLSSYFNYKIALLNNCGISGRKAVSCLIGGLSDDNRNLKFEALNKNFATPEDLYNFLNSKCEEDVHSDDHKLKDVCGKCLEPGHDASSCLHSDNKAERKHLPKNVKAPHISEETDAKNQKDVYLNETLMRAYFDDSCPFITVREQDAHLAHIKYSRRLQTITGSSRVTFTAIGQSNVQLRVDNVICDVKVYILKNSQQLSPVVLGRNILNYAHCYGKGNELFFSSKSRDVARNYGNQSGAQDSVYDREKFTQVIRERSPLGHSGYGSRYKRMTSSPPIQSSYHLYTSKTYYGKCNFVLLFL